MAQSGSPSGPPPGPRPSFARTPTALQPNTRKPQTDLLDLRDRHEGHVPVTPLSAIASSILCVAGCDGVATTVASLPLRSGAIFAVVGPIENAKIIKASVETPASAAVPSVGDMGVVTCLAGCDASDRRVMQATGGPLPLQHRQPSLPPRLITAAAAPIVTKSAATQVAQIKLKRTHAVHAKRLDKKPRTTARRASSVQIAQAVKPAMPTLATVGVPVPIQPSQPGHKPQPALAKAQAVVTPKKPVSVNTSSDWFNKISREQAAKKTADDAAQ